MKGYERLPMVAKARRHSEGTVSVLTDVKPIKRKERADLSSFKSFKQVVQLHERTYGGLRARGR